MLLRKSHKIFLAFLFVLCILLFNLTRETNFDYLKTQPQENYCSFQFTVNEIANLSKIHRPIVSDKQLLEDLKNCSVFTAARLYPITDEERDFPIAYSISLYKNVGQLARLLALLYAPQNFYCIHVDQKSDPSVHGTVAALAACFDNVIVTNSEFVYWGGFGVLKAALNCARDLHSLSTQWRYMITLASQDVPLKTNLEIVRILHLLNGTNDVELEHEVDFKRYFYSHIIKTMNGTPVTHVPDFQSNKLPIPHGLRIYKGNFAAALTHEFVLFLLQDKRVQDFILWLRDTDTSDEHLWSTINHNTELGAPGGYAADCHDDAKPKSWVTRYVNWRSNNRSCGGKFRRDVCVFGVGDLDALRRLPHLFANKFYLEYQTPAFETMEKWLKCKAQHQIVEIDEDYYRKLDSVEQKKGRLCPERKSPKQPEFIISGIARENLS